MGCLDIRMGSLAASCGCVVQTVAVRSDPRICALMMFGSVGPRPLLSPSSLAVAPSFNFAAAAADSQVVAFSLAFVDPVKSQQAAEPNELYSRRPVTYPIPHGIPSRDFPGKGFSPILTMVTNLTLLILKAPVAAR